LGGVLGGLCLLPLAFCLLPSSPLIPDSDVAKLNPTIWSNVFELV
jgi:hypothetical protein